MDFVHGVGTTGMKTMMEKQMDLHVNSAGKDKNILTWEETAPGKINFGCRVIQR